MDARNERSSQSASLDAECSFISIDPTKYQVAQAYSESALNVLCFQSVVGVIEDSVGKLVLYELLSEAAI